MEDNNIKKILEKELEKVELTYALSKENQIRIIKPFVSVLNKTIKQSKEELIEKVGVEFSELIIKNSIYSLLMNIRNNFNLNEIEIKIKK